MNIKKHRFPIALGAAAIIAITGGLNPEKIGDRLQFALPVAGMVCAMDVKKLGSYVGRFVAGLGSVHLLKNTLPDDGINQRPDGHSHGFPSGHTFASAYGASFVAYECGSRVPYVGPAVVIAAGFTGASRVDADKHNPFQVLWGALFALAFDRGLRQNGRLKNWLTRVIKRKNK